MVAVATAQEFQRVFTGYDRSTPGVVSYGFAMADRRVSVYYVWDTEFGPGFIKVPLSGQGVGQRSRVGQAPVRGDRNRLRCMSKGDDPDGLQAVCDQLCAERVQAFVDR